jgi:Na+-driven multidrug efflux pump
MNILSLTFMPGHACGRAATPLGGQYRGAERPDDAEHCANTSRNMGMAVGILMVLVFIFFGEQIAWLYTDDMSVVLLSAQVLLIYSFAQPAQSTQFVLAGALRGAGDTMYPLYSTAIGIWGGRVILGWLFVNIFEMGLPGAWVAMALDQCARAVLIYLRFKSGKWKAAKVWSKKEPVEELAEAATE